MNAISSYRANRLTNIPTHKPTHKQTRAITIRCAPQLTTHC